MSLNKWLRNRENGLMTTINDRDMVMRQVYSSIKTFSHWNDTGCRNKTTEFGAIFNLEFSPEGTIVAAACEKKSILLFDSITTKETHKILDAHTSHVNCIKFLDERQFASCSDDTTIALWDLRCLKKQVRSLHGHSNWVKNVEYSQSDKLLVTSGFDGSIFTWDINSPTEQGFLNAKIFHTSGLMRCRLVPDGSKMVLCSTGGYLMIVHNLDLNTLHKDLCGFRPSIYRLMQMGHQYIPQAAKFDHVFSKRQKRNRVELVTDFPSDDDAEVVFALQIHPQGHSILSRNISYDEASEWSCIHDIQEEPGDITDTINVHNMNRKRKLDDDKQRSSSSNSTSLSDAISTIHRRQFNHLSRTYDRGGSSSASAQSSNSTNERSANEESSNSNGIGNSRPEFVPDIWAAEVTVQERAMRQRQTCNSHSVTGYNFVYAISSGVLPVATPQASSVITSTNNSTTSSANINGRRHRSGSPHSSSSTDSSSSRVSNISSVSRRPILSTRSRQCTSMKLTRSPDRQIFQNPKKLMYYTQEPNKGKGFIKEPSFSGDGRIVGSPYDTGVRLLTVDENCSEYPYYSALADRKLAPRKLVELCTIYAHPDIVLCTKFSPRYPLLVTGCRSGKIAWHTPYL